MNMRPSTITITTKCLMCNSEFTRYRSAYKNRLPKNCSIECADNSKKITQKGKIPYKMTDIIRLKISRSMFGRPSPNKGKKLYWMRGKNHYNWKGGVSGDYRRISSSREWKDWREKIFERDNYTCMLCFGWGGKLHPHHIMGVAFYPKNVFEVNNGITTCVPCHSLIHRDKNLWNAGYYIRDRGERQFQS